MDWKEIYSREAPALYSYLLARGCSAFEAEDRIHEVFTAALSAGTRVENPRAYLFRAVRNALKRGLRGMTESGVTESGVTEIVDAGPNPGEGEAVNAALSALPAEQREVVVLKIWYEMSFREVGEALEITKDTAASRWRYGIEKLRNLLKGEANHGE